MTEQRTRQADSSQPVSVLPAIGERIGRYRWVICTLLLLGVTKNYMDRQVLGVLKTTLQHELGWTEIDYGNLVFVFQAAYGIGLVVMGGLIDRLGTRLGYALSIVFWSLASMAHAFGSSLSSFLFYRGALGIGESGLFPASIKAVAEWFPKKERALATGIFNAGTNVGAVITPLIAPWITIHWGWRWAFVVTGSLGFVWVIFWLVMYKLPQDHPKVKPAELAYIKSDPQQPVTKISWLKLLPHRQMWAFALGKFLIDGIWWFYLFWAPDLLQREYGLSLMQIGIPLMVIYIIADVGSVAGGWLSSSLIKRGSTVNFGRKVAMLVCAIAVLPIVTAGHMPHMWAATLIIGLAAAAHQGFSCNLFTLTSDMFPTRAVASVVGIGGLAGSLGGMLVAKIVGHVLQTTASYTVPLMMAGSAYLLALAVIHALVPHLEPAHIDEAVL